MSKCLIQTMKSLLLLIITYTSLVYSLPPPHPDVLALRREEELLHPLLKSRALQNPHLLQQLPLTSLLHAGEKLVFEREASKIPRHEIYKVLTHAGFIPRKRFQTIMKHNDVAIFISKEWPGFQDSYFPSPDILQYL